MKHVRFSRIAIGVCSIIFAFGGFGAVAVIVVGSSVISMQDAHSGTLSCSTNSWGTTNCNGPGGSTSCSTNSWGTTNCSGSGGSTSCSTNSWGTTNCSGPSGSTSCSTNSWGTTNCSGSGGSTSCSTNSWGTTNCSGSNGSYSCSTNSWGTTNCSGNGISIIPTPKPTVTKNYSYVTPTPMPTKTYSYVTPTPMPTKTYNYVTPTPAPISNLGKKVCVTSAGLPESCSDYPAFFIDYCSSSSGGILQWKNSGSWEKLWNLTGKKSSQCTSPGTPYYMAIQGELTTKSGISLRVLPKASQGVTPAPDMFAVKVK